MNITVDILCCRYSKYTLILRLIIWKESVLDRTHGMQTGLGFICQCDSTPFSHGLAKLRSKGNSEEQIRKGYDDK